MADAGIETLGLYAGVPVTARICQWLAVAFSLLFVGGVQAFVWGLAMIVTLAFTASAPVRMKSPGWVLALIMVLVLTALAIAGNWAFSKTAILPRLFYGPPLFGRLAGPRAALVRTAFSASSELEMEYSREDRPHIDTLSEFAAGALERLTRNRWIDTREPRVQDETDPQLDREWREVWKAILKIRVNYKSDRRFQEWLSSDGFPQRTIAFEIIGVNALFDPIYRVSLTLIAWLSYQALLNPAAALPLLQVSLLLSFFLSGSIYIFYSFDLAAQRLRIIGLPEPIDPQIKALEGKLVRPTRLLHTDRYIGILRHMFARCIMVGTSFVALNGIVLCIVSLSVGLVIAPGARSELLLIYGKLVAIMVLIPLGLVAGHYIMFFLLQNVRALSVAAICTALVALIPLGATYLWSGHVPGTATTTITSAVSAVVGGITGTLTSRIKTATSKSGPTRRLRRPKSDSGRKPDTSSGRS